MVSSTQLCLVMMLATFSAHSVFSAKDTDQSSNEVLAEKWKAAFKVLDGDKDGFYSLEDEFALAQKLIDYYDPPDDLIPGLMQFWQFYKDVIEAYFVDDPTKTALNQSDYVAAHISYWNEHFDLFKQSVYTYYTAMFHAMDSDKDGVISYDEFEYSYNMYGDSESLNDKAREVFESIDSDGDDFIDEDEFLDTFLNYFVDPDITVKELPLCSIKHRYAIR